MNEYHKIQTVYLRDPATNHRTLLMDQYAKPEFDCLADARWEFTEKVDGTNIRVMFDGEFVTFGGKTDRAQIPNFLMERLEALFRPKEDLFLEQFGGPVCLYGEGFGPKIQKGGCYGGAVDFCLFDVRIGDWWLERDSMMDVARAFGLQVAPVVGYGTLREFVSLAASAPISTWGDFPMEGLIGRPTAGLFNRKGERVITKIKLKDFG